MYPITSSPPPPHPASSPHNKDNNKEQKRLNWLWLLKNAVAETRTTIIGSIVVPLRSSLKSFERSKSLVTYQFYVNHKKIHFAVARKEHFLSQLLFTSTKWHSRQFSFIFIYHTTKGNFFIGFYNFWTWFGNMKARRAFRLFLVSFIQSSSSCVF